jgi:hypothetical protein
VARTCVGSSPNPVKIHLRPAPVASVSGSSSGCTLSGSDRSAKNETKPSLPGALPAPLGRLRASSHAGERFREFFLLAAGVVHFPAAKGAPQHKVRSRRSFGAVRSALTDVRSPKNVPLDPVRRQVGDGGHAGALPVDSRVRHSVELGQSRVAWVSHAIAARLAGIGKNHDLLPLTRERVVTCSRLWIKIARERKIFRQNVVWQY